MTTTLSGTIGVIPQFDSTQIEEWIELLEAWFYANNVATDEKKRSVLLTSLGSKGYHTLRALLQPHKPTDKSYEDCIDLLKRHFAPKPSETVLRYRFYTRSQKPNETVAEFVAGLRQLSEHCNFKELNNMLRDRLVVGCREPAIQRKLLGEASLTFERALQLATAMEMANKGVENIKQINNPAESTTVNKMHLKKTKPSKPFGKSNGDQLPRQKGTEVTRSSNTNDASTRKCWRCGGSHAPEMCRFKTEQCHKCQRTGHTKSQCEKVAAFNSKRKFKPKAHHLHEDEDQVEEMEFAALSHLEGCTLNKLTKSKPYHLIMKINGHEVNMELDTGSPWTIISLKTYSKVGRLSELKPSKAGLKTYTGNKVPIVGEAMVSVQHASQPAKQLPLFVVDEGVSLIGREWIEQIPLSLTEILPCHAISDNTEASVDTNIDTTAELNKILKAHEQVFDDSTLGLLQGFKAKVYPVKEEPKFFKAAPVAYATRQKIDKCLDEMLEQGVLEAVKFSDYACPIVVAPKPNGQIRICGNYKITANKVLRLEQYPLPTLEDMMQDLQGGQKYTKIDLSHAYHQIELDEEARKYTTINTHRGLYQYTRVPFGLASAPALFQRTIESLIADIPMCRPYLDDIIITGRTDAEHVENVKAVLQRLEEHGMRIRKGKCEFLKESVTYLGHRIDAEGIRPVGDKVEAIRQTPEPKNQEELQAYLGLLGYYRKFLPNLSTQIAPLTMLLKAEFKSGKKSKASSKTSVNPNFKWGPAQHQAFAKSKKLLESDALLVHFDPKKPLLLQADASPYGLGAVLSHEMPDGTDKPIAFASRTLTPSERNYAQYEKESLSIVFGLKKFHKYLHGNRFCIVTDHKPLVSLFGDKPASPMSSARVARWHMLLSAYEYSIVHKAGKLHANADALSRLPVSTMKEEAPWIHDELDNSVEKTRINLLVEVESRPVDAQELKVLTDKDPLLSKVRSYILRGWPDKHNTKGELSSYSSKQQELSLEDGVVLWGSRVVIPQDSKLRQRLMQELHATHPGIVKMKMLARSYFWWPGVDKELETLVKECPNCQENQKLPPHSPIHPWEFPEGPWQRLHIDYALVEGHEVLIVVDAYSKWIDAIPVHSASSQSTVRVMRKLFAAHGIPETIASDNGTPFVSEEFFCFLTNNGVEHIQTAPKHPSSNGLAERAVQTVKHGIRKIRGGDLEARLQKFLLQYRVTPQASTGKSPSELLYKRQLRTKLDMIRPNLAKKVKRQQKQMKDQADRGTRPRTLKTGDNVLVKNFGAGPTWLRGHVQGVISSSLFEIQLDDGRSVRRHIDHMRYGKYNPTPNPNQPEVIVPVYQEETPHLSTPQLPICTSDPFQSQITVQQQVDSDPTPVEPDQSDQQLHSPSPRVSARARRPPEHLKDYILYK